MTNILQKIMIVANPLVIMVLSSFYRLIMPKFGLKRSNWLFWLTLSLIVSLLYSIGVWQQAFASEFIVQDDARQHVFWMWRFVDPELFPDDLTADYFQSVAPIGYTSIYRCFAWLGINPILAHKLLPGILMLITTAYGFAAVLQILPVPAAGFFATLLLNQALWMKDDVVSSSPVAFVAPLFLAFLYYLLRRSLLPCLLAIALQGLFYPQCLFIFAGVLILQLFRWHHHKLHLSETKQDYVFCTAGLVTVFLVLLPYALQSSQFGPTITAAQARPLSTFSASGWSHFFNPSFREFWLCGKRSGILPSEWCRISYGTVNVKGELQPAWITSGDLLMPQIWLGILLPFLLRWTTLFPIAKQVKVKVVTLWQTLLVSIGFFLIAHFMIFRLHLPNRYTEHSFRIIFALAAGIAFTILFSTLLQISSRWGQNGFQLRSPVAFILAILLMGLLLVYPHYIRLAGFTFPNTRYLVPASIELYKFLAQQPKDSLIASIAPASNSIPILARRSLYVGNEGFILPYHLGYYRQATQRMQQLIKAQYSPDLALVQQWIQRSGVDFWLLERSAFKPNYFTRNDTLKEFSGIATPIKAQLQTGMTPALATAQTRSCQVWRDRRFLLLETQCLLKLPQ